MKKAYVFEESEINEVLRNLRQINHDADNIQQNKDNPKVVNGDAERIKTLAKMIIKKMHTS